LSAVLADRFLLGLDVEVLGWTPLAGPGGTIGAWLSMWLQESLDPLADALILGGVAFVVLVLIADRLLWGAASSTWDGLRWVLALRGQKAPRRLAIPPLRAEEEAGDEEDSEEEDEEDLAAEKVPEPRTIPIRHHDRVDAAALNAGKSGG